MNKLQTTPSALNNAAWFPIDNAANLYCAARRAVWCRTFRTAFILDQPVRPEIMQQALTELSARMPSFCARMQDGLFWSYFEHTNAPILEKETAFPCSPIALKQTAQPDYRVMYAGRRISLDIFHGLSDGGAAMLFLTALATRYFELQGETISEYPFLPRVGELATEEETTDPYVLNGTVPHAAGSKQETDVYYEKPRWEPGYLRVIHGIMELDQLKKTAEKHALTITEYFSAVLIHSFLQTAETPIEKPLRISIPINLRHRFETNSHRNFAYMQPISFDPRGLERPIAFETICDQIRGQLRALTEPELLRKEISANVAAQKNPVLRVIPYPIKRLFLKSAYRKSQEMFTTFISNAGTVQAPPEVLRHIERAEFILGDTPHQPFGCAVMSVNDRTTVTFSDCGGDPAKQRFFFRFLAADGINLKIETNEESR